MRAALITEGDMPVIMSWWRDRGEGEMIPGLLPERGWAVWDDGAPLMAAWLMEPRGCRACYIEWLVSRPDLSLQQAREAGRMLLDAMSTAAREAGFLHVLVSTESVALSNEFHKSGFNLCGGNFIHLHKPL